MKLIMAVIQPEELPEIKEELLKRKIYKFTISSARGQGKEIPINEVYRGVSHQVTRQVVRLFEREFLPHPKLPNLVDLQV